MLARWNVTIASRVMLPAYPGLLGYLGAGFLLTPEAELLETPVYRSMAALMPLRLWGAGLVAIAVAQVVSLLLKKRAPYAGSLCVVIVWMTAWAAVNIVSYFQGEASPLAWPWPAFAATCCWATLLSLKAGER